MMMMAAHAGCCACCGQQYAGAWDLKKKWSEGGYRTCQWKRGNVLDATGCSANCSAVGRGACGVQAGTDRRWCDMLRPVLRLRG